MIHQMGAAALATVLLILMIAVSVAMQRVGARSAANHPERKRNLGALEGGVIGLLGLLLAFSFSAASNRFDQRGTLLLEAVDALRTVSVVTDLYPADARAAMRTDLLEYVNAQIDFYDAGANPARLDAARERTARAQQAMWNRALQLQRDLPAPFASNQVIPALTRAFSLTEHRHAAMRLHVPDAIVVVLFVLALSVAGISGYAAGIDRSVSIVGCVGFALLVSMVIFITLDLDRPGRGLIRLHAQEQSLIELRDTLQGTAVTARAFD